MDYNLNEVYPTIKLRIEFLKGLIHLIKIDNSITELEIELFNDTSSKLGLNEEEYNSLFKNTDEVDLSNSFLTHPQKLVFLKEAIQLCLVDGKYDIKEKNQIESFAIQLDFDLELLYDLEEWTIEGFEWFKKGLKIFGMHEELSSINHIGE